MIINNKSVILVVLLGMHYVYAMEKYDLFMLYSEMYNDLQCVASFHEQILKRAQKIENVGDSMSSIEKLENLIGDNYFEKRKDIIKFMIERENIHPNNISYQTDNPLREGMIHNDINFITYLLNHGAQPKNLQLTWSNFAYDKIKKKNELRQLFLQHNIIFYNKNDKGDIFPYWHHDDPVQNVTKSLSHLIDFIKPKEKEIHFIMDVPYEKKEILDEIQKIGFKIHFSDNKTTQLIYKKENNSKDNKAFTHNPADIVQHVAIEPSSTPVKCDVMLWEHGK